LHILFESACLVSCSPPAIDQFNLLLSKRLHTFIVFLNFVQNLLLLVLIRTHYSFNSLSFLQPILV